MTNLTKEEQIFQRRMIELSQSAYQKGICCFTDFLTLYEISKFYTILKELAPVPYSLWGGYKEAERKLICFHGDIPNKMSEISSEEFSSLSFYPITCITLTPANMKFAETLTHRDYMGAVLNLGIDRSKVGDIVLKEKTAYVFCDFILAQFLLDNLEKIRHTKIVCKKIEREELMFKQEYQTISGSVSSVRLDSVISVAFKTSRNSILPYITNGKVFINGREIVNNSYILKENDIISVRGLGKVKYIGSKTVSKKGRIHITLLKYK